MAFLDDRYLLSSDTAFGLFGLVRDLPIIDAHNHADVQAIHANENFTDLWQAEGATDHYVWEVLRKRGVPEELLTGAERSNEEKWTAMAGAFEDLIGNPTYEWIHLDLRRCLGIDDLICGRDAAAIWEKGNAVLQTPECRPQALLKRMGVEAMCSTDDPIDSLEHHRALQYSSIPGVVRPTFRPDKAVHIFKPGWRDYIGGLEQRTNQALTSVRELVAGLQITHDYFADNGCVASDHGTDAPYAYAVAEEDADTIYRKAYDREELSGDEVVAFMSYLLNEVAEMDAAKGWVFQLHLGAVRDARDSLLRNVGPDSGGDISDHLVPIVEPFKDFLNRFDGRLKTVLYSLDPNHQVTLAGLCRAFGATVNLGSAWWLTDSPIGMKRQLEYVGSVDMLANMAGMVSDSRKLLSYGSRHEMFRRVLCDVVGTMVDRGQAPVHLAERLVTRLSYDRPKELFGL